MIEMWNQIKQIYMNVYVYMYASLGVLSVNENFFS